VGLHVLVETVEEQD